MTQQDRDEFIALMTYEGCPLRVLQHTLLITRKLHRLAERECNQTLTLLEQEHRKKMQDQLIERLSPYAIAPLFQNDPRGAVVKLKVPSGRTNDWGREGICVPV